MDQGDFGRTGGRQDMRAGLRENKNGARCRVAHQHGAEEGCRARHGRVGRARCLLEGRSPQGQAHPQQRWSETAGAAWCPSVLPSRRDIKKPAGAGAVRPRQAGRG